jgi:glycerol-3-phosphate O-acyltransferase/dihydroxyacetone phosphate acyltransferase
MGLIYWIVKSASQTSTKFYFRNIYVIGQENIPTDGPLIICGNHSNQFIDPMMIMNYCEREINFTMAASSFNKKIVGSVAKLLNVIPVNRPEDYKIKGSGKVQVSLEMSKIIVTGIKTNFQEESKNLGKGFSIMIMNSIFMVDRIIDSKSLIMKENFDFKAINFKDEYEYYVKYNFN